MSQQVGSDIGANLLLFTDFSYVLCNTCLEDFTAVTAPWSMLPTRLLSFRFRCFRSTRWTKYENKGQSSCMHSLKHVWSFQADWNGTSVFLLCLLFCKWKAILGRLILVHANLLSYIVYFLCFLGLCFGCWSHRCGERWLFVAGRFFSGSLVLA